MPCPQFGQLGNGSMVDSNAPVPVAGLSSSGDVSSGGVTLLSCGWRHTIAVTAAGETFSWGRGVNGQLGHAQLRDTCALLPNLAPMLQPKNIILSLSLTGCRSLVVPKAQPS
jgi:alpha-tubulin suppressor-like RCC1 family protein